MRIIHFFWGCFVILSLLFTTSCVKSKDITYFQPENDSIDPQVTEIVNQFVLKIQPGDILSIRVNSLSPDASSIFNPLPQSSSAFQQSVGIIAPNPVIGYLVDNSGKITIPLVGDVIVKDLTTEEVRIFLEKELEKYLISPTINVRVANFKISVLGEVGRPATYTIPNEAITLPEALALAGDLTIYGKRENILVIREKDGKRTFARIDLRNRNFFNSDYYYLHPNDVVYVEAKPSKATGTELIYQLSGTILSALTFVLTIVNVLK